MDLTSLETKKYSNLTEIADMKNQYTGKKTLKKWSLNQYNKNEIN